MISISCTKCKRVLTIDDAFAGGVCRCQHCGTIQTVPAKLKPGDTVAHESLSGTALGGSRATAARRGDGRGDTGMSSGLDELADIVASSGLAGSGLSSRRLQRPGGKGAAAAAADASAAKKNQLVLYAVAGAVVLAIVVLVAVLATRSGGGTRQTGTSGGGGTGATGVNTAAQPSGRGPQFCGTPLGSAQTVVYVLDRGSGTRDVFDAMKQATLRSIESLGPDRKFQIVFWANGQDEAVMPPGAAAYATPERLADVRKRLDDVVAFGSTDVKPALQKAVGQAADAIVIATGKGADLGDDFAMAVETGRTGSPAKLFTFSLGEADSDVLRKLAEKTGGTYAQVSTSTLHSSGR